MSWSVTTPDGTAEQLLQHLDAMELAAEGNEYLDLCRAEAQAQLDAGKKALKDLLSSGTLGVPGSIFRVSINGHSNPAHIPVSGWAFEMLNVVVYELAQPEVPVEKDIEFGEAESEVPTENP